MDGWDGNSANNDAAGTSEMFPKLEQTLNHPINDNPRGERKAKQTTLTNVKPSVPGKCLCCSFLPRCRVVVVVVVVVMMLLLLLLPPPVMMMIAAGVLAVCRIDGRGRLTTATSRKQTNSHHSAKCHSFQSSCSW